MSEDSYRFEGSLSPRVRGIHCAGELLACSVGSIPACAGKPASNWKARPRSGVYPRVCGETKCRPRKAFWCGGLSPRVRGIRGDGAAAVHQGGSIPACTRNPADDLHSVHLLEVYPRVYGESHVMAKLSASNLGLSPRVRGIREPAFRVATDQRSIPACTGNPIRRPTGCCTRRVYPRVYGESAAGSFAVVPAAGLSPRVRGIRRCAAGADVVRGSIPACTGNPGASTMPRSTSWVYPRVYGESTT